MNVTVSYTPGKKFRWFPHVTFQSWPIARPPFDAWYRDIYWGFLHIQLDNEQ